MEGKNVLKCYRLELPTTNALQTTYRSKHGYVDTSKYGVLYALAYSVLEIGERFPDALKVDELGLGHICGDDRDGPSS